MHFERFGDFFDVVDCLFGASSPRYFNDFLVACAIWNTGRRRVATVSVWLHAYNLHGPAGPALRMNIEIILSMNCPSVKIALRAVLYPVGLCIWRTGREKINGKYDTTGNRDKMLRGQWAHGINMGDQETWTRWQIDHTRVYMPARREHDLTNGCTTRCNHEIKWQCGINLFLKLYYVATWFTRRCSNVRFDEKLLTTKSN